MEEYLMHKAKGWTKKNHKYLNRIWKNGKWFYVYKNGRKYNRIQDLVGVDERDAFVDAVERWKKYDKTRFSNQNLTGREFDARSKRYHKLQKINNEKFAAWEKTLDYKLSSIKSQADYTKELARRFIDNIKYKASKTTIDLFPKKRKKK